MSVLQPTQIQQQILNKLNLFITQHQIQLHQFWNTNRLCLTLQEFIILLDNIHYLLSKEEKEKLQTNMVQFINLEVVLKGVEYWRNKEGSISRYISKGDRKMQPKFVTNNNHSPVLQKQGSKLLKYQLPIKPTKDNFTSTQKTNKSTKGIDRQVTKQIKLNQTLIRARNESDYQLTIKIGQANDICNSLKNNLSYLIDSQKGQIIEIKMKNGEQKIITRKQFQKRYQSLKIASFSSKKNVEDNLQEDLKKTLVQVMYLSGELEQQINLLLRKGINH